MQTELIIVNDYCHKCHIDPSFITLLGDEGLIEIQTEAGERYLLVSELPELEKYCRLYYDLSINVEGIDTIRLLLERIQSMNDEINLLKAKLNIYQRFAYEELEEAEY